MKSSSKNLILSAACGIDPNSLNFFLKTLRNFYNGEVLFLINPNDTELKKKLDFYNKGIDRFENIKDVSSLTSTQQNQFKAYQTQSPVIDKKKLDDFISKVEYPITYFDFETFTDAVPVFKKQRPHMQMPFQYSMHIQSSRDEILDINDPHPEFIANHLDDPRANS